MNCGHYLCLIDVVKKRIAPVENECRGESNITVLTLHVSLNVIRAICNVKAVKELLNTVYSLIAVKLVTVNEIAESLYLNYLKIILSVVMLTGSSIIRGISRVSSKATVFLNSRYRIKLKAVYVLQGGIQKLEEALVCGGFFLECLSDYRDSILGNEKTRVTLCD